MSQTSEAIVERKLTAYEAQVLIGTSISGCTMPPDRVFDLTAAWASLYEKGLIDRTDGLAIATNAGQAVIEAMLALQAAEAEREKVEPVGEVGSMPGTSGFTMATFRAESVPVGTKLYASQPPTNKDAEALLKAMEDGCWTLRCTDYQIADTGDADVGWEVIEHHMAKPHERLIGQGRTPRKALMDALHSKDGETL